MDPVEAQAAIQTMLIIMGIVFIPLVVIQIWAMIAIIKIPRRLDRLNNIFEGKADE